MDAKATESPVDTTGNPEDGDGESSPNSATSIAVNASITAAAAFLVLVFTACYKFFKSTRGRRSCARTRRTTLGIGRTHYYGQQRQVVLEDGQGGGKTFRATSGTPATNMPHGTRPSPASASLGKSLVVRLSSRGEKDEPRPESAAVADGGLPGSGPPSYASLPSKERAGATLVFAADTASGESKSERDPAQNVGTAEAAGGLGVAQAVLEAAEHLAQLSAVPVVSEAATLVVVLVNLLSDRLRHKLRTRSEELRGLIHLVAIC